MRTNEEEVELAKKFLWNKVLAYRWNTVNFLSRGFKNRNLCHPNGDLEWLGIYVGKARRGKASFAEKGYADKYQWAIETLLTEEGLDKIDDYVWKFVEDNWTKVASLALSDLVYGMPGGVDPVSPERYEEAKKNLWDGHVRKGDKEQT